MNKLHVNQSWDHRGLTVCFAGLPAGEDTGEDGKSILSSPITT